MKEAFKKIKERLKANSVSGQYGNEYVESVFLNQAIEIVNQVAEEYGSNSADVNEIFDILDQFHMFQGQRAGRELWGDKPKAVQDRDIANFNRNLQTIRNYIKEISNMSEKLTRSDGKDTNVRSNDGCCEWIKYDYRTIAPKNHDAKNPYWRIPEDMSKLRFCPYCGKEIKVME